MKAGSVRPWAIGGVLGALLVFDLGLWAMTVAWPQLWFSQLHGAVEVDPLALAFLRRCGANWAAFAAIEAVALARWRRAPVWLAVVGGVRLSDALTDWTYLATSPSVLPPGVAALLLAGLANVVLGAWFFAAWRRVTP